MNRAQRQASNDHQQRTTEEPLLVPAAKGTLTNSKRRANPTGRADDERETTRTQGSTIDHQLIDSTRSRSTTPTARLTRRQQLDERREARIDQRRPPAIRRTTGGADPTTRKQYSDLDQRPASRMDQRARGDERDNRDDTTTDHGQRRRGDNKRQGSDHDARVRGGGADVDVESRGRDVNGAGVGLRGDAIVTVLGATRRWERRRQRDADTTGEAKQRRRRGRRRRRPNSESDATVGGGDEGRNPKPPQRGTAIDGCSAGDSDRQERREGKRAGGWSEKSIPPDCRRQMVQDGADVDD